MKVQVFLTIKEDAADLSQRLNAIFKAQKTDIIQRCASSEAQKEYIQYKHCKLFAKSLSRCMIVIGNL